MGWNLSDICVWMLLSRRPLENPGEGWVAAVAEAAATVQKCIPLSDPSIFHQHQVAAGDGVAQPHHAGAGNQHISCHASARCTS